MDKCMRICAQLICRIVSLIGYTVLYYNSSVRAISYRKLTRTMESRTDAGRAGTSGGTSMKRYRELRHTAESQIADEDYETNVCCFPH
jgi:hypothetical protein